MELQSADPEEIVRLIEQNRRAGEALRDLMLGAGPASDLSIFRVGATVWRGYTNETTVARPLVSEPAGEPRKAAPSSDRRPSTTKSSFRRENFTVLPGLDGFTFTEVLVRDLPNGTRHQARLCGVCQVCDGQITHVDEYADAAQVREVVGR